MGIVVAALRASSMWWRSQQEKSKLFPCLLTCMVAGVRFDLTTFWL